MKPFLLKIIANRKRLNRLNKSHYRSEQFITNLEYWLSCGADVKKLVKRHESAIRILMTSNFTNEFEKLCHDLEDHAKIG